MQRATDLRRWSSSEANHFLESGSREIFQQMREKANPDYPITVYYAFKQTEEDVPDETRANQPRSASTGWETMLEGLIQCRIYDYRNMANANGIREIG